MLVKIKLSLCLIKPHSMKSILRVQLHAYFTLELCGDKCLASRPSRFAEDVSHTLKCDGTKIWRYSILDKRFKNIGTEIDIRRRVGFENKEQWNKIGIPNI
jgi:hypothetical protein